MNGQVTKVQESTKEGITGASRYKRGFDMVELNHKRDEQDSSPKTGVYVEHDRRQQNSKKHIKQQTSYLDYTIATRNKNHEQPPSGLGTIME